MGQGGFSHAERKIKINRQEIKNEAFSGFIEPI
jgi:hypothetical protein